MTAFTPGERSWCGDDAAAFALAWALKEAAVKLLGTGFDGIGWRGVWSRPAGRDGIEVVVGEEARALQRARDLPGPLWCAVGGDGERVVAVLVAGAADVAIRAVGFADLADRRARHVASRSAGRRAGLAAAAALAPAGAAGARWLAPDGAAPSVVWSDGSTAAASCSHDAGLACAAVARAKQQDFGSSGCQRSGLLTFCYNVTKV